MERLITYSEAINDALHTSMKFDKKLFVWVWELMILKIYLELQRIY